MDVNEVSGDIELINGGFGVEDDTGPAGGDIDEDEDNVGGEDDGQGNSQGDGQDGAEPDEDFLDTEDEEKDEEDGEEDADPEAKKFKVTVDGEEQEVSFKEMQEGYIRTKTFHQRLNRLNEAANAIHREAQSVIQRRDKSIEKYSEIEATLSAILPKEPDWDEEFKKDPAAARQLQKNYGEFSAQIKSVRDAREKMEAERAAETEAEMVRFAEAENAKIPRVFPHWADPKKREAERTSMRRTAKVHGFTEEEIDGIVDVRYLTILAKAAKLDRMQARRAQPQAQQPRGKVKSNPGAGSNRTAPKGMGQAQQRLAKTGSIDDAGSVFARILERS